MSKVKFNPFAPTKHSFENIIDGFFNSSISEIVGSDFVVNRPSVNVVESEKEFTIDIAAPGLEKADFHIDIEKDQLTISVEKEAAKDSETEKFTRREFSYAQFKRNFHIPETVDIDKIKATYTNGILALTLPKKEEVVPATRKIKIS